MKTFYVQKFSMISTGTTVCDKLSGVYEVQARDGLSAIGKLKRKYRGICGDAQYLRASKSLPMGFDLLAVQR